MADSAIFDLSAYPIPDAIEVPDFEALLVEFEDRVVERFPGLEGLIKLQSEPSAAIAQAATYREMDLRSDFNDVIRSNILFFSTGADLELLAGFYDVVRMPGEDDDRLKLRTILAIQGRSTGGTAPRYRYIAMSADIRVQDAEVYTVGLSPQVNVAIYSTDNAGQADAALLQKVHDALHNPNVRMVNDIIVVRAAVFQTVNIEADVWLLPATGDTVLLPGGALETSLRAAWAAETGMGFDLLPQWIESRLMQPGIYKATVLQPSTDIIAAPYAAISIGTVTFNNRGRAR